MMVIRLGHFARRGDNQIYTPKKCKTDLIPSIRSASDDIAKLDGVSILFLERQTSLSLPKEVEIRSSSSLFSMSPE